MFSEWEYYKDFTVDLSMVNNAEEYKDLLSRDGGNNGSVILTFGSYLFSISENVTNFISMNLDFSTIYVAIY